MLGEKGNNFLSEVVNRTVRERRRRARPNKAVGPGVSHIPARDQGILAWAVIRDAASQLRSEGEDQP